MKKLNQNGSHIVAIALVILVVGVIGFVGYTVMNRSQPSNDTSPEKTTTVQAPDTIKTKSDLTATSKSLDSDDTTVNNDLDTSSLDDNLNDLL